MEDQLVWKEEFNIGVEIIDKEHQRLFSIINRLFIVIPYGYEILRHN